MVVVPFTFTPGFQIMKWVIGDICELLIFNRLLNQQEIDSGEAYLAKKWGLTQM